MAQKKEISLSDMFSVNDSYREDAKEDISPKQEAETGELKEDAVALETEDSKSESPAEKNEKFSLFRKKPAAKAQDSVPEDAAIVSKSQKPESADDYSTSVLVSEAASLSNFYLTDESGCETEINRTFYTVGCGSGCDLKIDCDPKLHTVSRCHANLISRNDTLYVKDLSSNGTFIGFPGEALLRLPSDIEVELRDGQLIRFADRTYSFHKR